MDEDPNFKTLLVQNLHTGTSTQLDVMANPCTLTTELFWNLATLGFAKQEQLYAKQTILNDILSLDTKSSPMELEVAHGHRP